MSLIKNRPHPFGPSLDRIVPELGYVNDNIRVVCWAVNLARSDWDDDVLLTVARAVYQSLELSAEALLREYSSGGEQ